MNEFGVRQIDSGAANQVVFETERSVRPESDRDYAPTVQLEQQDILVFGVDSTTAYVRSERINSR